MNDPTELATLAQDIADAVCACLSGTTNGTPDECTVYWSSPPDDLDCGDCGNNGSLIVWLDQLFVTKEWPSPYGAPIRRETLTTAAVLNVRLIRPCWPMVGDLPQPLPSRATTATHAENLMEDAATTLCCIVAEVKQEAGIFASCSRVALGTLRPDPNRGGCAGFTVPVTVDLGACCEPIPA